ncbi:MAG: SCO family protein [Bacteroidota bacterium]|nr:SCO family protein [Bacteroidota bacterium]
MNRLYSVLMFLFFVAVSFGQTPVQQGDDVEVGIVEHLGDTIPLDLKFSNEKDQLVSLRSLVNKPTVLSFVYFDCPGLCSPLLNGISSVIEKSDMQLGKDYQVITVSFNFRDNPEKGRQKKEKFLQTHSKSHAASWIYLTGDSTSIYKLSNAVGFKFKRAGVDFIHPAAIMVLSPSGKITRYLYGLTFLPFDLKMAVVEARKGLARPTINKVLEFCFAYDPAGKRYALEVTKISGVIILFILILFGLGLLVKAKKRKARS